MRCSRQDLEKELLGLLGSGRDAQIAAHYYGFDGLGGKTLLSVAEAAGLTRERIRQIVAAVSERIRAKQPVLRILDRTIAFICERTPAPAEEVEAELRSQGLTSGLFRLEGVIHAAELFGKALSFSITKMDGKRLVHAPCVDVPCIPRIARRLVAHRGISTLSDVVGEVRRVKPGAGDGILITTVVSHQAGFSWLDRTSGWFWLSDQPNNPVLNRTRKILSVANAVDVRTLRTGIGRDYRMAGFFPPESVLLEFCRQAPGVRVYNGTIKAAPPVNSNEVLTRAERDIARILSQCARAMAANELKPLCLGIGMNAVTFFHTLEYSPIVLKDAAGKYRLIGSGGESYFRAEEHRSRVRVRLPELAWQETCAPRNVP